MGIGYTLEDSRTGRGLVAVGAQIGKGTNNEAEYQALLAGMRHALRLGWWNLRVEGDSLLVTNQLTGQWSVKDKRLKRLYDEVKNLMRLFQKIDFYHVYRELNQGADELSRMMVFEEPELPPLPLSAFQKPVALYQWQAAAVRVWWKKFHPGSGTLSRIFGVTPQQIEAVGYDTAYRDASFSQYRKFQLMLMQNAPPDFERPNGEMGQGCSTGLCSINSRHTCGIDGDPGAVAPLDGSCAVCQIGDANEP